MNLSIKNTYYQNLSFFLPSILLGVISGVTFAPYSIYPLVWINLIPLMYVLFKYKNDYKKLFWQGVLFSVFFNVTTFYWMVYMFYMFGGFPWILSLILFLLASVFLNLKFPFFLILSAWLLKKVPKARWIIIPFIGVITDAYTPQVFPWFWGNFLAEDIRAAQFAEYVGAYGLSAILFVGNLFLYQTIRWLRILKNKRFILNSKKLYIFPILFLIMIAILELGGNQIIKNWESKTVVRKTNVAIIQPDGPLEFRDGRNPRIVMDELLMRVRKLTSEVANGRSLDLIVLPESGIPFFSANPTALNQINQIYWPEFDILMRELSTKYNANVFFNELDMGNSKTGRLVYYNSSVLYDRQGMRRQSYQKSYLLMFGEYMPFEFLYDLSPQTGNFEPGIQLQPISYYSQDKQVSGSFVPLICYEVIIPEFVRSFDRIDDFDFFVNVTNDKWYGPGRESYEHLTLARLRAIEHRRWIVRSTNSGTSAFVDHLGRIVDNEFTPLLSSAAIYQQVPSFKESPTFYSRFGDLLVFLFLGLGMAIIGFLWTR